MLRLFKLTLIFSLAVLHCGFTAIIPDSGLCASKEAEVNLNELERQLPIGKIDCGEVVAYLRALSRYYNRKCNRMGNDCRDKDLYPVKWFDQVIQMMTQVCQQMQKQETAEAKAKEAVKKPGKETVETQAKRQAKKPPCGSRNRVM